jgi:hypothetical protein
MIESFRQFIGTNQMMAYLVMMAVRLKELHRVLNPTGGFIFTGTSTPPETLVKSES